MGWGEGNKGDPVPLQELSEFRKADPIRDPNHPGIVLNNWGLQLPGGSNAAPPLPKKKAHPQFLQRTFVPTPVPPPASHPPAPIRIPTLPPAAPLPLPSARETRLGAQGFAREHRAKRYMITAHSSGPLASDGDRGNAPAVQPGDGPCIIYININMCRYMYIAIYIYTCIHICAIYRYIYKSRQLLFFCFFGGEGGGGGYRTYIYIHTLHIYI